MGHIPVQTPIKQMFLWIWSSGKSSCVNKWIPRSISQLLTFVQYYMHLSSICDDKYSKLILLYAKLIFCYFSMYTLFTKKICLLFSAHAVLLLISSFQPLFWLSLSSTGQASSLTALLCRTTFSFSEHTSLQLISLFPVFYISSPIRLKAPESQRPRTACTAEDFHFSSFIKETVGVGHHRDIFILSHSFALLQLPYKTVRVGNTS